MKIIATLQELLGMVRNCEFTRINGTCMECPLFGVLSDSDGECDGLDEFCEVENGHQEDS